MMRHVMATAAALRALDPSLPAPLSSLVARCLEKEPAARPTAAALAAELGAFADAGGVPALAKLAPASRGEATVRARNTPTPASA